MWAVLVLALGIWVSTVVSGIAGQNWDLSKRYQARSKQLKVITLAESLEQFYLENGGYPASIPALTTVPGYTHTRSLVDAWQGYGISPAINDGVWLFNRMVLISNNPSKGVDAAAYMASNTCGTGGYDTATSWCGSPSGSWYRRDTRDLYNGQISTQRVRMGRLLQKMADYYNANGKFPNVDATGTALAANSIQTIAALANFSGSNATCSGNYTYQGIPIDCGDMFDQWGRTVSYQFVTKKHIVAISETPIFNNSGTRVVVAADFDNTLLH